MSKELLENLLIEFDEMGFEPTTLCDSQREIDSFRRRLKQVLDYLKSIDNAKPSETIKKYETIYDLALAYCEEHNPEIIRSVLETRNDTIKQALLKLQEQEKVLSIISKKGLPLYEIQMIKQSENYEQYNIKFSWCNPKNVTTQKNKEEFDTLKRWVENEKI